jgi:hypothetical protein
MRFYIGDSAATSMMFRFPDQQGHLPQRTG